MTNEQIDHTLALKVMGWHDNDDCPRGYRPSWSVNEGQNDGPYYEDWRPSERIEDAWQVLEKLRLKYDVVVCNGPLGWYCTLSKNGAAYDGVGASAAMAISLAAIRSVGVEAQP